MTYVIIGNSAAAVGCIDGIRKNDREGKITVVADEPYRAYSRPLISYWLSGKVNDQRMYYRAQDYYEKNKVTALLGKKAAAIDPDAKTVRLDDGTALSYDRLFVGTGSRPFVPPIKGVADCKNVYTFLSWDSAKQLKAAATPESRVCVLGAGLIGLKVAEGLAGHVGSVTVIEMAPHLMPSVLDDAGAAFVQKYIESKGLSFIFGDAVSKVEEDKLTLSSGKTVAYDIFVVAAGVRPNVELVKNAGGEVGRGIVIDGKASTSLPDVYAGGDCVETADVVTGARRIMALLPNAYMQGEAAGKNMAGDTQARFDKSMPMNAISFFGLPMVTAGSYEGEEYLKTGEDFYKKLVFKDNRLVGYILINCIDRAGIYTALIREKVDLAGVDRNLLKDRPQLMMFAKADRERILAGGGIAK